MNRLAAACLCLVGVAACLDAAPPSFPVAGGNQPPLPQLDAAAANIEPAALEAAAAVAAEQGADALLVARNGHRVLERYWRGTDGRSVVPAGEWQAVIDGLLVGALLQDRRPVDVEAPITREVIERASGSEYASYLSRRLWRLIGAADATLATELYAEQADFLRIGELLANDGLYQGEQVVPPGWTSRLLARGSREPNGGEPFAAKDLRAFSGARGAQLWVVPSARLVILRTGGPTSPVEGADSARIPNLVVHGLTDQPAPRSANDATPDPSTLVPAH